MNIDTGELRMFTPDIAKELMRGFTPVPDELHEEARREFFAAGVPETEAVKVDLNGDSALAKWAHEQRDERDRTREAAKKRKRKQKTARRSRARNR